MSLNRPDIQALLNRHDFFIITDEDMDFAHIRFRHTIYPCWASELLGTINQHPNIGKLGIKVVSEQETVRRSQEYMQRNNPAARLHSEFISCQPVDTTAAIYRSGLYVPGNNIFSPRHNKLIRDNLLSCTLLTVSSRSLSNENEGGHYQDRDYLMSKAVCFALNGAWLSSDHYAATPLAGKIFYRLIRPLAWWISVLDAIRRLLQWRIIRALPWLKPQPEGSSRS
jgi:hypothetical protein